MAYSDNIPSNSINKNFNARPRTDKTDYGVLPDDMKAIKKKKSWLMKFILPEDVPDLTTYLKDQGFNIVMYIIKPKIQQILSDSFNSLIGMNSTVKRDDRGGGLIPKVSYNNQYNYQKIPVTAQNKRSYIMYQDIYLQSEDACLKFKTLVEDLFHDQGGYITVLQYMNMAGEETYSEQNNYGWTSLNGFKYRYTVDGWLVTMPYPTSLD